MLFFTEAILLCAVRDAQCKTRESPLLPSFVTLTPGPVGTCRHAVPLEEKKLKAVSLLKSVQSTEVGKAFCISCIKLHSYDLQILWKVNWQKGVSSKVS